MDDFDLFDGLSLKASTPSHAEQATHPPPAMPMHTTAQPQKSTPTHNHAHSISNGHQQQQPLAPLEQLAPTASGGDDDMFSGLTVASDDAPATTTDDAAGGSSLLSMLNSDDGSSGGQTDGASANEPSSFSFVSESSSTAAPTDADAGVSSGGGSSFSFLTSSSPAAPVEDAPLQYNAYDPSPQQTNHRKVSISESPSVISHTSPYNPPSTSSTPASVTATAVPAATAATPSTVTPARKSSSAAPTFEQVHALLDESLTSYWDNLKSISLTQSALRTQQIGLQAALKSTADQLAALEVQQQSEIEAENYEGADQINSQMDALKSQLAKDSAELARITSSIGAQEANKSNLRILTRETLDECVRNLQLLAKQHTFQMTHTITTQTQALEQKEDILLTDLEKTRRNLQHTLQDLATLQADEVSIAEQIATDTKEMNEEHSVLQSHLSKLELERDELRRLLQAKDDEVTMCSQKIDVVSTGITNKKAAHSKKLARLAEKKARMQSEQTAAKDAEAALLHAKEKLEREFQAVAHAEKNSTKRLKKMQEEAAYIQTVMMQKLEHPAAAVTADASSASEEKKDASESLQSLQARLSSTLASLDSTRSQLLSLDSSAEGLQKQIESLSARIPSMELDKTSAVNARDFKKAGVVSKEIKSLQTQKAELEASLAELKAQVVTLNASLVTLADTKATLQKDIVASESETDKKRLSQFLQDRAVLLWKNKQVEKLMRKNETERNEERESLGGAQQPLSPVTSPIPNASASFGSIHHFSYLSHEHSCTSVEIELLSKEIDEVRKKHGWADSYLREEAAAELAARRLAANEPKIVDEDEEAAAASAAEPSTPQQAEEESSISEQRRKDRNAAIAAAAAAAEAESQASQAPAASPTLASASSTELPSSPASAAVVNGEEAAAAAAASDAAAVASPVEAAAPDAAAAPAPLTPEPEPAAPAVPTAEFIAALRASYSAVVSEISALELSLQAAVDAEDFEEAERIDTALPTKREEKAQIEKDAEEKSIALNE